MTNLVTEVATFRILEKIPEKEFIGIVNDLEKNFHSQQDGFIDSELFYDEREKLWYMIQHWESINKAHDSSREMMKNEITMHFRMALDPKTVRLKFYNCLGKWNNYS